MRELGSFRVDQLVSVWLRVHHLVECSFEGISGICTLMLWWNVRLKPHVNCIVPLEEQIERCLNPILKTSQISSNISLEVVELILTYTFM